MDKVPNMVSSKDLSYTADAFDWNFVIAKKCLDYANNVEDKEISKNLEKAHKMHKTICSELLENLKEDK